MTPERMAELRLDVEVAISDPHDGYVMAERLGEALDEIERLQEANRWRDVAVEPQPGPPQANECWPTVLVRSRFGRIDVWFCCQWGDDRIHQTEITHWRPLPDPPPQ